MNNQSHQLLRDLTDIESNIRTLICILERLEIFYSNEDSTDTYCCIQLVKVWARIIQKSMKDSITELDCLLLHNNLSLTTKN